MISYSNCEKNGFLPVFPTPGRHRKMIAFISVIILCVVVIMSVLAATGVFVKGNDGIEGVDFNATAPPAPTSSPTANATGTPAVGSTSKPTNGPTSKPTFSSQELNVSETNPTFSPSAITLTSSPSANVTGTPTGTPTSTLTSTPTAGPTMKPTPTVTYFPGLLTVVENGLLLSQGLTSRIIARSGSEVSYFNGSTSAVPFHFRPDFGATFAVPDDAAENQGGWVYVSNSEILDEGKGGVGAITFDKDGNAIHYEMLLEGTTSNCAGGKTPWETWVSCEEVAEIGEIYQVDPFGRRAAEKLTLSTQQSGRYEAFTYDDRNKTQPRFYVTEDQQSGPTRRWTPSPESIDWNDPWDILHGNGTVEYLVLYESETNNDNGSYEWVSSLQQARSHVNYPGSEGIDRKDNVLFIITKTEKFLYMIDLDSDSYWRTSTLFGLFDGAPDQIEHLLNGDDEIVYFTEDGGSDPGIHGRNAEGQFVTILEAPGWGPETTGLAWDPSGKHMYVALQEDGVLFDITRTDGYPFQGMSWR